MNKSTTCDMVGLADVIDLTPENSNIFTDYLKKFALEGFKKPKQDVKRGGVLFGLCLPYACDTNNIHNKDHWKVGDFWDEKQKPRLSKLSVFWIREGTTFELDIPGEAGKKVVSYDGRNILVDSEDDFNEDDFERRSDIFVPENEKKRIEEDKVAEADRQAKAEADRQAKAEADRKALLAKQSQSAAKPRSLMRPDADVTSTGVTVPVAPKASKKPRSGRQATANMVKKPAISTRREEMEKNDGTDMYRPFAGLKKDLATKKADASDEDLPMEENSSAETANAASAIA